MGIYLDKKSGPGKGVPKGFMSNLCIRGPGSKMQKQSVNTPSLAIRKPLG
jgi:hypothetical protein